MASKSQQVTRTLIRALYRTTKQYDKNPKLKLFLRNPVFFADSVFTTIYPTKLEFAFSSLKENHTVKQLFTKTFQGKASYTPYVSFKDLLMDTCRQHRDEQDAKKVKELTEAGFIMLRFLSTAEEDASKILAEEIEEAEASKEDKVEYVADENIKLTDTLAPGKYLISHRTSFDTSETGGTIFRNAVILITEYSKRTGAVGLIVNKPINSKMNFGGPVPVRFLEEKDPRAVYVLHDAKGKEIFENHSTKLITENLFITKMKRNDFDTLNTEGLEYKVFDTCCTWYQGQLENEIGKWGSWFTVEAPEKYAMDKEEKSIDLYNKMLYSLGGEYKEFIGPTEKNLQFPPELTINMPRRREQPRGYIINIE